MGQRKPFLLRISPELWDDLEKWARDEMRSVNGQIEYLLKQCVLKRKGALPPAPGSATEGQVSPDSLEDLSQEGSGG
jgi:hypothetical protein